MTLRVLDLADGYSSNNEPSIMSSLSGELVEYASDAAYEAANGSPDGSEIYFNTTDSVIRFHNGTSWTTIGEDISAYQEVPSGVVDGVNVDFDITFAAANDTSIWVYIDGILQPNDRWSFSTPTITFTTAPVLGQSVYVVYLTNGSSATFTVPTGLQVVDSITVTLTDFNNKYITLSPAPASGPKVQVFWQYGLQRYGTDYTISGSTLDWNGYTLDALMQVGDIFDLYYFS